MAVDKEPSCFTYFVQLKEYKTDALKKPDMQLYSFIYNRIIISKKLNKFYQQQITLWKFRTTFF